jgi:hypothetical protein
VVELLTLILLLSCIANLELGVGAAEGSEGILTDKAEVAFVFDAVFEQQLVLDGGLLFV